MTKTAEDLAKMDPNQIAHYATNMSRKSPALRREARAAWATLQADVMRAVEGSAARGHAMAQWQIIEKLSQARMGLLCAIVLGHSKEALDAGRRACGLVLLGEDGEPV